MSADKIPLKAVDWDDVELAFRIGEQTLEEIGAEHGCTLSEIESRAFRGDWYEGWEAEAIHPKYVMFVNEYMLDWDGAAAMARAGIKSCTVKALLANAKVRTLIRKRMKAAAVRANICQDDVLAMWLRIANVDIRKFYDAKGNLLPVHELDDDCALALQSIKVTEGKAEDGSTVTYDTKDIKLADRLAVLRDIGKHLGMFTEKHEVTGKNGEPLIPKEVSENEAARRVAFLLLQANHNQEKASTP